MVEENDDSDKNINICKKEKSPKQSILKPEKLQTKPPMGTLTINRRKNKPKDIKRKSICTEDLSDVTQGHDNQIYEYIKARIQSFESEKLKYILY